MTKLFVVGFPRDMDKTKLLELFSLHGAVDLVTVVTDKETGLSLGYGFIQMQDELGAKRAIAALNDVAIYERKISVRLADVKPEQKTTAKRKRPRIVR